MSSLNRPITNAQIDRAREMGACESWCARAKIKPRKTVREHLSRHAWWALQYAPKICIDLGVFVKLAREEPVVALKYAPAICLDLGIFEELAYREPWSALQYAPEICRGLGIFTEELALRNFRSR